MAKPPGIPHFFNQASNGKRISAIKADSKNGTNNDSAIFIPAITTTNDAVVIKPLAMGADKASPAFSWDEAV